MTDELALAEPDTTDVIDASSHLDYLSERRPRPGPLSQLGEGQGEGEAGSSAFRSALVRLARAFALVGAAGAGLILLVAIVNTYLTPAAFQKDFVQDYLMAKAVAGGTNPYATITALAVQYVPEALPSMEHPTPHPPTAALLLLPFTIAPADIAARWWLVVELASLLGTVTALVCFVGAKPRPLLLVALAVSSVLWFPVFEELGAGQLTLPVLALSAGGQLALDRRRPVAAGILFGLGILVKPILWLVIPYLAYRRDWRGLSATIGVVGAGYLSAVVVMGPSRVIDYFVRVLPFVTAVYRATSRNVSLWSVGWRIFDGTHGTALGIHFPGGVDAPPLIAWSAAAPIVAAILPLIALAIAVAAIRGEREGAAGIGAIVCVSLLVSPTAWDFYLVLLALPFATIARELAKRKFPVRETIVALAIVALTAIPDATLVSLAGALSGSATSGVPFPRVAPGPALLTLLPIVAIVGALCVIRAMSASRLVVAAAGTRVKREKANGTPR